MEMQQLRYFRVVAQLQHVTKAATKLSVSQSAVSRAISQMEHELGVPLFIRQGRAIVLTRYGAIYLEHVIRAQAALDSGKRILQEDSGEQAGTISLGFLGSLGTDMVPKLIKDFRRKHPLVKFNLKVAQNPIVRPLGIGLVEGRYLPPCSDAFLKMVRSQYVRPKAL